MNSVVTQRFINCHNKLISDNVVRSSRQFALSIDYLPQSLGEILKGRRDATIEVLRKSVERYQINPMYLLSGQGAMIQDSLEDQASDGAPVTVVLDENQSERIVHVPVAAQAGYGGQIHDKHFFQELPTFTLPDMRFSKGTFRCFDVAGDSMEPTLFQGDKIVCSFIEPEAYQSIKDNFVYVIVTNGDVLVKRVVNKIQDSGGLELFSDNSYYDPYPIDIQDVKEIWYVKVKISPFMPSPSNMRNSFSIELDEMKNTIESQSTLINNLNTAIEKMLKQQRARMV